ncbi:MAG: ABC transporter substrate-binding protein [Thermotogae bacterium]|nr:ABC transporter substrate-binding protein [Thermotogota bacterium]
MRKLLVVLLLALTALGVAESVKIGVVLPMTGGIAAFGQMTWEGVQIAYEFKPKVLGKNIELVLLDNRSDKVEAANAVARAIDYEKVVAILGQVASSHTLAGGAVAEKKGVPMVSSASTNPLVTQGKKYVSRVCFTDPYQGAAMAEFAFKNLGVKSVAVFTDIEQDYSVGLSAFFRAAFKKLGGKVFNEFYRTGDQDFTAQLTDVLNKNPDAVYVTGYYPEIALLSRQARDLGYQGYILTGDGADAPETVQIGGKAVDNLHFTTHFHPKGATTELGKKFIERYREKYGKDPAALAALGFDAYMVIVNAIERAASTDPGKIAEEIRNTKDYAGATGVITIDKEGNALKPVVINKIENGKFEYVTSLIPSV